MVDRQLRVNFRKVGLLKVSPKSSGSSPTCNWVKQLRSDRLISYLTVFCVCLITCWICLLNLTQLLARVYQLFFGSQFFYYFNACSVICNWRGSVPWNGFNGPETLLSIDLSCSFDLRQQFGVLVWSSLNFCLAHGLSNFLSSSVLTCN